MYGEAPIGVKDDLPNSTLFLVETAPRWVELIIEVLTSGFVEPRGLTTDAINELAHCKPHVLVSGRLYKRGSDEVLRLCICLDDHDLIIKNAHISWGGLHVSVVGKQLNAY